jgi:hypothetical protein
MAMYLRVSRHAICPTTNGTRKGHGMDTYPRDRNHKEKTRDWMPRAGFSLLELMFASGILALALALIFGSLLSIAAVENVNRANTQATALLSSLMEDVLRTPYSSLLQYTPPSVSGLGSGATVTVACITSSGGQITLPYSGSGTPALPNPVEVVITLTWQDAKGHSYRAQGSVLRSP